MLVRRDTHEKQSVSLDTIEKSVAELLDVIQENMLEAAREYRIRQTTPVHNREEFEAAAEKKGFIKAMWCGETECELALKEQTGLTTRCMPFEDAEPLSDVCADEPA